MSKLFNHNTGKWELHPEDGVDAAVRSGDYTFYKDTEVPVVSPEGELGSIPSEKAYEYFNKGYRWQTDRDRKAYEAGNLAAIKEKNFGDQTGAAAAMGALDTATFGGSSALIRAADKTGELTKAAREIKDRNTGAYIAGSIAGAVLPGALAKGVAMGAAKAGNLALKTATGIEGAGEIAALTGAASNVGTAQKVAGALTSLPQQAAKLGKAAEGITQAALTPVTSKIASNFGRNIVEKTAQKVAGGIVEGTAYGLGAGISEASLGRPEDVVDSIISNMGMGAMTGGAFGAVIGGAPVVGSALKDLGGRAISGVRSAVEEAARKGLRGAAVASAKNKGVSDDLVAVLRDAFNDEGAVKTAMDLHAAGKIDEFSKFVKDTEKQLRKATAETSRDLTRSLKNTLQAAKGDSKMYIQKVISETGDDMYSAINAIEKDIKTAYSYFDDALAKSDPYAGPARSNPSQLADLIESNAVGFKDPAAKERLSRAAMQLRAPGLSAADESAILGQVRGALPVGPTDKAAQTARDAIMVAVEPLTVKTTPKPLLDEWGKKIGALVNSSDAHVSEAGKSLDSALNVLKSAGSEAESFAALRAIKKEATDFVYPSGGPKRPVDKGLRELNDSLVSYLRGHPNKALASQLLDIDTYYSSYKILKKGLSSNDKGIKRAAISRLVNDPTYGSRIRPALDNFAEFMPEIEATIKNAGKAKTRAKALNDLASEMNRRMKLSDTGKLDADDMEALFDIIGTDKNISGRIDALKKTTQLLKETADMSTTDRLVALARAAGNEEAVQHVQKMLPHSETMEKIALLKSLGGATSNAARNTAEDLVAYAVAGPTGPVVTKAMQTARRINRSPWTAYETFKALQGITNAGAKVADSVYQHVVGALFKSVEVGAKKALPSAIMGSTSTQDSRKAKLDRFKEIQANLAEAASPERISSNIEENLGHIQHIPSVKAAMATRMAGAAQFLQETMPADPTAQFSSMGGDSDWTPSDQQLNTFLARVDAANNPLKTLSKIADGSITPEEVQTVQALHPNLFNGLREKVISGIIESKGRMPYESKLVLSSVFGIPVDYSMSPEFIANMQGAYAPVDKGGRPETAETRKKNLNINPLGSMTETARVSYGRK